MYQRVVLLLTFVEHRDAAIINVKKEQATKSLHNCSMSRQKSPPILNV